VNFHLLGLFVLTFELNNILGRCKYAAAVYAFPIVYGLCINFILALFEGQTVLTSKRCTTVSCGKCRLLQLWKMSFCYCFSRSFSIVPVPFESTNYIILLVVAFSVTPV